MNEMKNRTRRTGATVVEVAIVLPILFMFLFASYELARANMLLHATESAAYEGARIGIVPGADKDKIKKAVEFVLNSVGASEFKVIITPNKIDKGTEKVKVRVELSLRKNTTVSRFFVQDPLLVGECELNRETF